MNDQQRIERQILAMHREIAARVRAGDARPLAKARENLARWERQMGGLPPAYQEWSRLLDAGVDHWLAILDDPGENATRLRSSAPFAGTLTPQERWKILRDAA